MEVDSEPKETSPVESIIKSMESESDQMSFLPESHPRPGKGEKAFANPGYGEAIPRLGKYGHCHERRDGEEDKYEDVDHNVYIDMEGMDGKDLYDFGENGIYQKILFKSKIETDKASSREKASQTGIKRNKSLRLACNADDKDEDEKETLFFDETFDSLLTSSSSSSKLKDQEEVEEAKGSKAKSLLTSSEQKTFLTSSEQKTLLTSSEQRLEDLGKGFKAKTLLTSSEQKTLLTSSERRLVADFLRSMSIETSIS